MSDIECQKCQWYLRRENAPYGFGFCSRAELASIDGGACCVPNDGCCIMFKTRKETE